MLKVALECASNILGMNEGMSCTAFKTAQDFSNMVGITGKIGERHFRSRIILYEQRSVPSFQSAIMLV